MKQQRTEQELIDHWTLSPDEKTLVRNISKIDYNQLGYGVLLKIFQREGKFPLRKQDIPRLIVGHIGQQLHMGTHVFDSYNWKGRTIERHRSYIRRYLGVRLGSIKDTKTVLAWLSTHDQLLEEHNFDRLREVVYERYKELKIEPPEPKRVERLIHSAVRSADDRLYTKVLEKLTLEAKTKLDALLNENVSLGNPSFLSDLKAEAGAATLENIFSEIVKLELIRSLGLPANLFAGVSPKRLLWCKQRIAVEDLSEIRRHPPKVRYSLLAAFCIFRAEEITDTLVELLISVIHKMGSRAKHIVNKEIIRDIKRVQGKNRLLYEVAQASIEKPEGTIRQVIYPVAPEQTLHNLVAEYKQGGLYEQRIQTIMRGSYSNHYRRMVPPVLKILSFCATNDTSKPIIEALEPKIC